MAVVTELFRSEDNGTLSFGDYTLAQKAKKGDIHRYLLVTPNLPDATCLIAEHLLSPSAPTVSLSSSSPPSPEFDLP